LFALCATWDLSSTFLKILDFEIIDPQSEYCVPANFLCHCPIFAEYGSNVESNLKLNLFGQAEAVQGLINAIRLHDFRGGKSTAIHIAGVWRTIVLISSFSCYLFLFIVVREADA
jgi:hypothetical protein